MSQTLYKLGNRIRHNVRIFLVVSSALFTNIRNDPCNLLRFFWVASLEMHSRRQAEATGNTVWYRISRSDCMADAMAQAYTTGVEEGKQRSVTCHEELGADIRVLWVCFGLWQIREKVFDGFQTHSLRWNLGSEGVVHQFDSVV